MDRKSTLGIVRVVLTKESCSVGSACGFYLLNGLGRVCFVQGCFVFVAHRVTTVALDRGTLKTIRKLSANIIYLVLFA